jgi:hypothetical protein
MQVGRIIEVSTVYSPADIFCCMMAGYSELSNDEITAQVLT